MPLSTVLAQAPTQARLTPRAALFVACLIAVVVSALEMVTPADYDVGVLYGIAIVTSVWTGSRKLVWVGAGLFVAFVLAGAVIGASSRSDWLKLSLSRSLTALSLLVIAGLVQNWMTHMSHTEAQRALSRHLLQTLDLTQATIRKLDGTILFWSRGAERLYGWSAEEATGKLSHDLFATNFGVETLEQINAQLQRTGNWIGELHHVRKDGTPIWVASHWTLHSNGLFAFPIVTEVNNDVTTLKAAESRFRNLTEVLPHLVWLVSPSGQILYVNKRWQEYFGREPEEIVSSPNAMSQFVHPDDRLDLLGRWQQAFRTGIMEPWEIRYRRQDGVYRWFTGRAVAARNGAGEIEHWIGTATDIDDQKKVAERLRENQKLESIGRLAGGVAHDFNNLLTAITGYNDFLNEEVADNPRAAGYSLEIKKASDRAAALTKQLLSFSRPQLAKPQPVDLNKTVMDISKILTRIMGEDVQLVSRLEPHLPNILADPVQIDQIIMNLAVNARDAMPDGGTFRLETGVAQVGEIEGRERQVGSGLYAMLTATDSGVGMDEATKARLFEPFFTTKERGKGTGLGLSILFGVVKHSGGFVEVTSEPGAGARFAICLPASTQPCTAEPPPSLERTPVTGREMILVVEDEDAVRTLVCQSLRKWGYQVLAAATPSAGINLAREAGEHIDLLLTDVLMPEMRGPALVSNIRQIRPDIPVMYMSGYSDSAFLDPKALEGAFFIQKPFKPEDLAQKVAEILGTSG